jgi:excisionase family DNA binding protein
MSLQERVMQGRFLTVAQVAERLQTTPDTIRRWIREGKLKAVMPGGAKLGYRIAEADVERLLGVQPEDLRGTR